MHELAKVRHNENMAKENVNPNYAGAVTSTTDAGTIKQNVDLFSGTEYKYFTDEQGEGQWDWNMIHGCMCDSGYMGYDCSLRSCPKGDDPVTGNSADEIQDVVQVDEVQVLRCTSTNGTFTLNFKGETTQAIKFNSTASDLQAALEALPSIGTVAVEFKQSAMWVCTEKRIQENSNKDSNENAVVTVTFTSNNGPQPLLNVDESNLVDGTIVVVRGGSLLGGVTSVAGTKEYMDCGNRGLCDETSGICSCFKNYGVDLAGSCSNIIGVTNDCPGEIECSGHGVCVAGSKTCICSNGWMTGDCSIRTCPAGPSWFGYPSEDNKAHDFAKPVECSNQGLCARDKGECICKQGFLGGACEHMVCAGDPVCSGHGQCLTMKQLALAKAINGDATDFTYGMDPHNSRTWDATMVYGCHCDEGYEGYDCSLRSCPKGDDPMTYGQEDEMQLLSCRATEGFFRVQFRQEFSDLILWNATAEELEAGIETMSTAGDVSVVFTNATLNTVTPNNSTNGTFCNTDGSNSAMITFKEVHGDLPALQLDSSRLIDSSTGVSLSGELRIATDGAALPLYNESLVSVTGTREYMECSGRGVCNHLTGTCVCYSGYAQSDGNGARGVIGDCGYVIEFVGASVSEE